MDAVIAVCAILIVLILLFVGFYLVHLKGQVTSAPKSTSPSISSLTKTTIPKGNMFYPSGCQGLNGYNCSNANISTDGLLSFSIAQNVSQTISNIHVACVATVNATGQPTNASAWRAIANDGTLKPGNYSGTALEEGESQNVESLQCYDQLGNPLVSMNINQRYIGLLLINYTYSALNSSQWIITKAASINVTAR